MAITFSRTGERTYTTIITHDDGVSIRVPSFDLWRGCPAIWTNTWLSARWDSRGASGSALLRAPCFRG